MRVLLDTHVLLWWVDGSSTLSAAAHRLFEDDDAELLWSAASTWELGIKVALGKLELPVPLAEFVPRTMSEQALLGLPVYHDHAARAATLPSIHRDPFDRMLCAQALVERVPLVTRDDRLRAYGVDCVPA